MSKQINLLGMKFGSLVVTAQEESKNKRSMWLCLCDCGETRITTEKSLLAKKTTGCKKKCTKVPDETGKMYGYWQVLRRESSDKYGFARFLCRCTNLIDGFIKCGKESIVKGIALRGGVSKSCTQCGHLLAGKKVYDKNSIDLTGKIFGRLKVIERLVEQGSSRRRWKCICICDSGKISLVRQEHLLGINVKTIQSCGCLTREAAVGNIYTLTHGLSTHPLYHIWSGIKTRCEKSTCHAFDRYGGRGIKLCPEWHNIKTFYDWAIKNGWERGLTIDRINNDGDYSPDNCQIITRSANALKLHVDKGSASFFNGEQININPLSKETGVPHMSCKKLIAAGYTPDDVKQYGKLKLFQRQAVGKSMKTNARIPMDNALKIKQVVLNPKKQASELGSYRAMMSRCYKPQDSSYKNYGKKGIKVCDQWIKGYTNFLKDMGQKPEPKNKYSIDRIDRNGDYAPENTRWLLSSENTKRTRKN